MPFSMEYSFGTKKNVLNFLAVIGLISLVACSSSDGDDDTDQTSPTETNNVSYAALETTKNIIDSKNSSLSIPLPNSSSHTGSLAINKVLLAKRDGYISELKATETETEIEEGNCGGQARYTSTTTTPDDSEQIYPILIDLEGSFDDYCISQSAQSVTYNGTLNFDYELTQSRLTYSYDINVSYVSSVNSISGSYQASESCTQENQQLVCTVGSSYVSSDGDTYTLSDASLSGDSQSGYNYSGTLTDTNNNTYSIDARGITVCDNGNIGTGTIDIDINGSDFAEVSFSDCDNFTVTYNGETSTLPQDPS